MREVAGVLVHDAQRTRGPIGPRPRDLRRVAHARAERATALRPRRILLEHVAVGLQVRAAACRVHDDRKVVAREGVDVQPRKLPRVLAVAGMRVQRTAAHLLNGGGDTMPIALEDSHGRSLGLTERLAHHAPSEQAHVSVRAFRQREWHTFGAWSERTEPPKATRTDAPREHGQPAAHDEIAELRHDGEPTRTRDGLEADPPHRALDRARGAALGEHFSSAFHDPAERNA